MLSRKDILVTRNGETSEIVVLAGMNIYNRKTGCYDNTITEAVKWIKKTKELRDSISVEIFIRNGIIRNNVLHELYVGTYYPQTGNFRSDGMYKIRKDGGKLIFEQPVRPATGPWVD